MFMTILLGVILGAALVLLFLVTPAILLQRLLRVVGSPPARGAAATDDFEAHTAVPGVPVRPLGLFRAVS
jgi:hypothetical protein